MEAKLERVCRAIVDHYGLAVKRTADEPTIVQVLGRTGRVVQYIELRWSAGQQKWKFFRPLYSPRALGAVAEIADGAQS